MCVSIPVATRRPGYRLIMRTDSASGALPGEDVVQQGIDDLVRGDETIESLLVSIGAPRLRRLGFEVAETLPEPESRLYRLLSEQHGDAAHSRYNALVRRLVSFERAAAAVGRAPNA
jgi:hypothetical protein